MKMRVRGRFFLYLHQMFILTRILHIVLHTVDRFFLLRFCRFCMLQKPPQNTYKKKIGLNMCPAKPNKTQTAVCIVFYGSIGASGTKPWVFEPDASSDFAVFDFVGCFFQNAYFFVTGFELPKSLFLKVLVKPCKPLEASLQKCPPGQQNHANRSKHAYKSTILNSKTM